LLAAPASSVASPVEHWGVTAGGFWIPRSLLVLGRVEAQRGHFALTAGIDRDSVDEPRDGGARDEYWLWSAALGVRAYTGRGSGGFAELSASCARLGLRSYDAAGAATDDFALIPLAAVTLGGRLSQHPSGWYGELGFRIIVSLAERHLYTTPDPPPGSRDAALSERSWFFGRGGRSAQLYVAGGYRF
jgi:hypothetical protein